MDYTRAWPYHLGNVDKDFIELIIQQIVKQTSWLCIYHYSSMYLDQVLYWQNYAEVLYSLTVSY